MYNKLFKIITILVASAQICVSNMVGKCNQCFPNSKIACIDEKHFSTCFEGFPTATITKCPGERFCTEDVLICHTLDEGYTPSCYHNYCGDCAVSNGIFTCLDETRYGYCFGGTTPLPGTVRSCPLGFVCNYNSPEVCVPENKNQPSCSGQTTTTDPSTSDTTEISTMPTSSTIDFTTTTETTNDITSTTTNGGTELTTESITEATTTTEISTTDSVTTTEISAPMTTTTTEIPITETTIPTTEIPTTDSTTTTEISTPKTSTTTEIPTTLTTTTTEILTTQTTETSTTQATTSTESTTTPTTTTSEITTTTTEISTTQTTAAPPRDAQTICGEIGMVGNFKSDDPTCRQYVYCYPLSGQYLGWFYYCDGYFNAATKKCQKERPSDCEAY